LAGNANAIEYAIGVSMKSGLTLTKIFASESISVIALSVSGLHDSITYNSLIIIFEIFSITLHYITLNNNVIEK
jgi:hypothetical protein